MKILSKKQWEKINQTIVDLQLDYNDVCEQLRLAEQQVSYLQDELRRANDIKKPTKCKCKGALFVENDDGQLELLVSDKQLKPKRGRKPRKEKEDEQKATKKEK